MASSLACALRRATLLSSLAASLLAGGGERLDGDPTSHTGALASVALIVAA